MPEFKYQLGEIVSINPANEGRGIRGKILGRTEFLDGALGYVVSALSIGHDTAVRHHVTEAELQPYVQSS